MPPRTYMYKFSYKFNYENKEVFVHFADVKDFDRFYKAYEKSGYYK